MCVTRKGRSCLLSSAPGVMNNIHCLDQNNQRQNLRLFRNVACHELRRKVRVLLGKAIHWHRSHYLQR
jgi:hypothetical protein